MRSARLRNFYVNAWIDGRNTPVSGGPAKKDGGMIVSIKQNQNGESAATVQVICSVDEITNEYVTQVIVPTGECVYTCRTKGAQK